MPTGAEMTDVPEPIPSATVVLLRDGARDIEVLLLQRSPRDGKPGPWVFPGGRVEPHDIAGSDPRSEASARAAAIRETHEEAGLRIEMARLEAISRWITPEVSSHRFDTWFFIGTRPADEPVRVDGEEISDHRWLSPGEILAAFGRKELRLAPPTFVTVSWLEEFVSADEAVAQLAARELVTFRPLILRTAQGSLVMLYPGDAGYDAADLEAQGARHRCHALEHGFRYERS